MIYAIADVPHADYDNYDMLNKLFHALSPHGWEHSSWKNDTCPSLLKEERHGNYCQDIRGLCQTLPCVKIQSGAYYHTTAMTQRVC